jgi:hypothetical protein
MPEQSDRSQNWPEEFWKHTQPRRFPVPSEFVRTQTNHSFAGISCRRQARDRHPLSRSSLHQSCDLIHQMPQD